MKKLKNKILIGCACMLASGFTGCAPQKQDLKEPSWYQTALRNAARQLTLSLAVSYTHLTLPTILRV